MLSWIKDLTKLLLGIAITTLLIGSFAIVIAPFVNAEAAPVKGVATAEYKIGRTTIYEWRTNHNRLCTMVVDQISSNTPFISCN